MSAVRESPDGPSDSVEMGRDEAASDVVGSEAAVDVEEVGQRVEDLLDRVAAADPAIAATVEALVAELVSMYGAGLQRLVDGLGDADPALLRRLAGDALLGGLMSLHDLHPVPLGDRVEAALDECRPFLDAHGGGVTLVAIDDGVVHLQLEGSCDGCGASEITLRNTVEAAIAAAAPDVARIDVEGAVAPGQGHAPPPDGPPAPMGTQPLGANSGSGQRQALPMFVPPAPSRAAG